jgi:hypothetical protein
VRYVGRYGKHQANFAMAAAAVEHLHIPIDSVAHHPQIVQSSIHGLVTATAISTTTKPLTLDQVNDAIKKYGPLLHLHPDEQFFNTSIDYFLAHSELIEVIDKKKKQTKSHGVVKAEELPQSGKDHSFYLNLKDDGKSGDFSQAKAYVRAFWKPGMAYTDLQFWLFNSYNGPGTLHIDGLKMDSIASSGDISVAPLGEHVGDWEMCMVRVNNTTLNVDGIWLSQHAKGHFVTADQLAGTLKFQGKQPIIYSARNGHGNFPSPGPNQTEFKKIGGIPAGFDFFVRNDCAEGGRTLDCSKSYELISADFLPGVKEPAWVTYPFAWGPEGTSTHITTAEIQELVHTAAGDELSRFLPFTGGVVLASEILPHFIKGDINGPASPSKHGSWMGTYPVY